MSTASTADRYRFIPEDSPAFFNAETLAPILGVSPQTVRWYRHMGTGPEGFRAPGGRRILYSAAAVDAWLAQAHDEQLGAEPA